MSPADRPKMQGADTGSAAPDHPGPQQPGSEGLAEALERTRSELAAAQVRLEEAEEEIAAVSEIAEAAQATIDMLRSELADAQAQNEQSVRQTNPSPGELPQRAKRGIPFFGLKFSGGLASRLVGRLAAPGSLRMPRFGPDREKPSVITLGDRARDAGQWEQAAGHYRKALHRNPRNSPIWVQYGHVLKQMGHMAQAEEAYRKAAELDPNAADPQLQLGHVLKLQRRRNEAVAAYLRALELDPTLHGASLELLALGWTGNSPARLSRQAR